MSLHFPTAAAFRKRDERTRDQLLVCGSQLEPHKHLCPGSDRQDIPLLGGNEIENTSLSSLLSGDL